VFFNREIPPYAILSYTWDDDEVTFDDVTGDITGLNSVLRNVCEKKGWKKVRGCCERALKDGWEYVWIDTCCIDKKNPLELS
jgi:Heterokaryon incompatibility protein (HET)